jgi:hypothetical protein
VPLPANASRRHWYAGSGDAVPGEAQFRKHSQATATALPPTAQEKPLGHTTPAAAVDALGQKNPFAEVQGAQKAGESLPALGLKVPPGQGVGAAVPKPAQKKPGGHGRHCAALVAPVASRKVPGAHSVKVAAAAAQ